jgi:ADP-ribose pyrophosphatase YjhB (NUDIX family)
MAHKIPYDKFIEIYSLVPRLCVEIVVKTNEGVLLTKRNIPPALGMWHLPGGTWLKGETAEEAAKRIALDELGIDISLGELLGYVDFSPEVAVGHSISLVFLVKPHSFDISPDITTVIIPSFFYHIAHNLISASIDHCIVSSAPYPILNVLLQSKGSVIHFSLRFLSDDDQYDALEEDSTRMEITKYIIGKLNGQIVSEKVNHDQKIKVILPVNIPQS